MINKIINAIANGINDSFKNIKIYTEEVKQGFEKPCFSIICTDIESNIYLGKRHRMKANVEIHYYNDKKRDYYNNVMLEVFNIIEKINVDNFPIRAIKMSVKKSDTYCLFNASYDFFYYVEESEEIMGSFTRTFTIQGK